VQIAIVIDVAFMVVVFLFVSLVRPDLHIESGRSLLEFRDPLSLGPKTEIVRMKIGKQANNASPIRRREGEQIEDKNCLRHKFIRRLPMPTSKR
jgi:hypothetical protein